MIARLDKHEIYRRLAHLSCLWIPAVIYFLDKQYALWLFCGLTICVLLIEFMYHSSDKVSAFYNRLFGTTLPRAERLRNGALTGASFMMLGTLFCLLFDKEISVTATAVLLVADTAAAIVGMAYGRTSIFGKSLEGSVAFLFSGIIILIFLGVLLPHGPHYFPSGATAVIAATFIELYSKKMHMNDNFSIPATICIVMWGLR